MNEYENEGKQRFAVKYYDYTESEEKMRFFNAKNKEEVKNHIIKKYGKNVEIMQITEMPYRKGDKMTIIVGNSKILADEIIIDDYLYLFINNILIARVERNNEKMIFREDDDLVVEDIEGDEK